MAGNKKTSDEAASKASEVLRDGRTAEESKSAAASALSQTGSDKETGERAASEASEVLRRDDTSKKSKSAAGSALSQKSKKG